MRSYGHFMLQGTASNTSDVHQQMQATDLNLKPQTADLYITPHVKRVQDSNFTISTLTKKRVTYNESKKTDVTEGGSRKIDKSIVGDKRSSDLDHSGLKKGKSNIIVNNNTNDERLGKIDYIARVNGSSSKIESRNVNVNFSLKTSTTTSRGPTASLNASSYITNSTGPEACMVSIYISCGEVPKANTTGNKLFHVAAINKNDWMTDAMFDFSRCEYSNCHYDGTDINETTEVVLVNANYLRNESLPKKRWPHQLYAVMTWESPPNTRAQFITG